MILIFFMIVSPLIYVLAETPRGRLIGCLDYGKIRCRMFFVCLLL